MSVTFDPNIDTIHVRYDVKRRDEWRAQDTYWHCGFSVTINDEPIEYLCSASRMVFVDRTRGVVVKVGSGWGATQCWDEFHTYHEVLDDEARMLVPDVLAFGVEQSDSMGICGYVVMEYIPDLRDGYGYGPVLPEFQPAATAWRAHVRSVLERKYNLRDLHGGNLQWRSDGTLCLVDLGISRRREAACSRSSYRTEHVRRAAQSLPAEAVRLLEIR